MQTFSSSIVKPLTHIFDVLARLRWVDTLDIVIVSVLLFIALRIIHRNVHKRVLVAILSLVLLYLSARLYQLQLTLRFIEIVAFSMSVGTVLLFQEDIRRFLESSLFSIFRNEQEAEPFNLWLKALSKSVATFSKNKIGALIVLEQKVPLTHLVDGGHKLNGEVSFPLLCSIFDPHSIGHDGAVIISGSHVTQFGAHLPLSRNSQLTGRLGTRHSAALGLSERTDAFVIVVSEETGEISIAHNGSFKKLTPEELETHLAALNETKIELDLSSRIRNYLYSTYPEKTLSLFTAIVLWFTFVAPGSPQQKTVLMPVTFEGVPRDLILDEPSPSEFKVTLAGTAEAFDLWPREKQNIHVSLEKITPGLQRIPLLSENIPLQSGLQVTQFDPPYLKLKVHKSRKITMPISLRSDDRQPTNSTLKFKIHPPQVTLLVREGDPGPDVVSTEPIDLSDKKRGDSFTAKLLSPQKSFFTAETPQKVQVTVE